MHPHPLLTALLAAVFLAAGCASVPPEVPAPDGVASAEARECTQWLASLDAAVEAAGVRDAGAYRIPGFAYLRADRFSASLRDAARRDADAFEAWTGRLRELDLVARGYELANLPASLLGGLRVAEARAGAERAAQCGALLAREELAVPERREALLARAVVPDDYAEWVRNTGVYAVASVPFAAGVAGWQKEAEAMFRKAASGEAHAGNLRRYDPAGQAASAEQVRGILARAPRDALGVPQLPAPDLDTLFRAYAPQYEIETTGAHDRFGPLLWKAGPAPEVDTGRPVVYRRLAYTRYGDRILVQLVYSIWFPERPADRFFDILAGKLDGLVFRVTLDEEGAPLVYDAIHPCGCYHMFFPTARAKPVPAPDPKEEWAFIPSTLPALGPAQRVAVRTATRSHYLVAVRPVEATAPETYAFANEDELRALPTPDGRTRSVFGPDALVAGTERRERALFWPMGIASPGTMRQWGRHPTAFLGRRHFDDADLIEKRFARDAPARP